MSLLPLGASIAQVALLTLVNPTLIIPRSIGSFIADVTVEEHHIDDLEITDHPVERGAAISDHAFKRPAHVLIKAGYSSSGLGALGDPTYINTVYNQFLELQASRRPFDILTAKRSYSNMLIRRLGVTTDARTENALLLNVECREVFIATTQTVTVPDPKNMKNPESTAGTINRGTLTAQPVAAVP